jgi:hypothetical protein
MAGNKELIDDIVSPVAVKQVTELDAVIVKLEATFAAAAKQALALTAATGGSTTGSGFAKSAADGQKAVDKLIASQERLNKTIISNSQAEVDAYEKSKNGQEGITSTVNKRNIAESKAAAEATARNGKILGQQQAQAKEYVRARGLIEAATTRLERYQILQAGTTDPKQLAVYNKKIQESENAIKQLSNVGKDGFDKFGNAIKGSQNYLTKAFSSVRSLAYILPGVGVAGILAFATEPIIDYITQLDIFKKKIQETTNATAIDGSDFTKALSSVNSLKTNIEEFNNGTISGKLLVERYNETIGKTAGILQTTAEVEAFYNSRADNYVQAIYLRAKANAALQLSTEKLNEAQKREFDAPTFGDVAKASFSNIFKLIKGDYAGLSNEIAKNQTAAVAKLDKQGKDAFLLFDKLQKESDAFNKKNGFGDLDGEKREQARLKAIENAKKIAKAKADAAKASAKELLELTNEYAKQIEDAQKTNEKNYNERQKEIFKNSQATLDQYSQQNLDRIEREKAEELAILADKYAKGKKTVQQYNDEKAKIESNAEIDSIAAKIDGVQKQIELEKLFNEDTSSDEKKLAELQIQLSKKVTDSKISDLEKQAAARQRISDIEKQLADATLTFIQTAVDAGFENRKNAIQKEIEQVDQRSSAEIDAVNRSLASNTEKAAKINIINAQADAQKKQLQQEQKKQDIEKAKFDKAISLARIVQATATAEIEALTYLSNPFTAPLYPAIAALIGALGAVQLATVLATPIPAYERGTTNAKGGASLVGEKGRELVMTPSGASFLTPGTPTIMDIPKGSTVVPHLQTARMQELNKYTGGQAIDMSEVVRAIEKNKPTNKPARVNGWLYEMKMAQGNIDRRKNYFN